MGEGQFVACFFNKAVQNPINSDARYCPGSIPKNVSDGAFEPVADLPQGAQSDVLNAHFQPMSRGVCFL
jgi:hypothetical protein